MKKLLQSLGTNILLLSLVSFLTDVSSEMTLAILPLFIVSLGGGGIAVGLVGGIGDSVASLLKVFSGYFSDKVGKRKPFAFYGYLISSVSKLFLPVITSWWQLLILRPIERVGKGVRSAPRDALIAASINPENRGTAFGFHRAMDSFGAVCGVLIALGIFWFEGSRFRLILGVSAILSFLALIPFAWVKEASGEVKQKNAVSFTKRMKDLPSKFKKYLAVAFIFSLADFTYMFYMLRSKDALSAVYSDKIATAFPIIMYCWYNIVYTLFSLPAGILSDKIGRKNTLRLGYIVFCISAIGFAMFHTIAAFVVLFAIYGIAYAMIEGNQRAFASDFVEEESRGSALGAFHTVISVSALLGSVFAGIFWNMNHQLPFLYGAALSLLASIIIRFI